MPVSLPSSTTAQSRLQIRLTPAGMAPTSIQSLANPLLNSVQLLIYKDQTTASAPSINFTQSLLTNSAGILLRLPQDVIANSLVLLQRYQILTAQPSSPHSSKFDAKAISASIIYLSAKMSFTPLSPRSVVNVYAYLTSIASPLWFINPTQPPSSTDGSSYYVSEGSYEREKLRLFAAETHVLATLGFDTRVVLPHTLALTYLQTLGVGQTELVKRVLEHLNGALTSPQFVCLTHQPNALAVAAIYLAAREVGVKLVEENWWEVFDVDREDLGFLVLAMGSLAGFASAVYEDVVTGKMPVQLAG